MGRWFIALMLVLALAVPAYALQFEKENVEVGLEYAYSHQDVEDINLIGGGYGDFSVGLVEKVSNVKVWDFAATLGYKINDAVTPYVVLGTAFLNLDQELKGNISGSDWSDSLTILTTQLRDASGFLIGMGAKGDVLKFDNGIIVAYDTRWTTFNTSSTEREATAFGEYGVSNKMKASLGEFYIDTVVKKYFDLTKETKNEDGTVTITKKYKVEGITPFIGGRWTHSDLNVKNNLTIPVDEGSIGINTESEYQGNMLSAIGGITIKINKNLDASIGGIVGQENGVQVKVGYSF